jgi:hypothetical protein
VYVYRTCNINEQGQNYTMEVLKGVAFDKTIEECTSVPSANNT